MHKTVHVIKLGFTQSLNLEVDKLYVLITASAFDYKSLQGIHFNSVNGDVLLLYIIAHACN